MGGDRGGVMPEAKRGFVLLASLFILASMATLVTLGLTRSMTELGATNRFVATQQALYLAEAKLDEVLVSLATTPNLTSCPAPTAFPTGTTTCTLTDQPDGTKRVTVTGFVPDATTPRAQETISARIQLQDLFPYAAIAGNLFLGGKVVLGDLASLTFPRSLGHLEVEVLGGMTCSLAAAASPDPAAAFPS